MRQGFRVIFFLSFFISLVSTVAFAASDITKDKMILQAEDGNTNPHSENSAGIESGEIIKNYIKITKSGDLVSAEIKNADIEEVIKRLSEECKFAYTIFPEMKKRTINTSFEKIPLIEGIEKIVHNNYLIEFGSDERIVKIYLLDRNDKELVARNKSIEAFKNKKALSLDELKGIVTGNVRREHPNARLFTIIPHKNLRGEMSSYIFSYFIGEGKMPDNDLLGKEIDLLWEKKEELKKTIDEGYRLRNSSLMIAAIKEYQELNNFTYKDNEYISLQIGTRYSDPPIKSFWHGLPMDISMLPVAKDVLKSKKQIENLMNYRIETIDLDILVTGFVFINDKANEKYYVDPVNKILFTHWSENKGAKGRKDESGRNDLREKEKWLQFIAQ